MASSSDPFGRSIGHGLFPVPLFPDARGSGIPQTKTALFALGGRISLRTVLGKFFCSSASLASGIALGREGPSVHIGAGIASVLARAVGLKEEKVKALLPVGAAAALAAAQFRVSVAMTKPEVRIQSSMEPEAALKLIEGANGDVWPVFDGEYFYGMISASELRLAVERGVPSAKPVAHGEHFPHVHADHALDVVLHRMGATGMKVLPVVSRSDIRVLEGIIRLEDILRVYGL